MKFNRLYRFLVLAMTGGMVFQTTTSCSDELLDSLATSLTDSIATALESAISTYIDTLVSGTA